MKYTDRLFSFDNLFHEGQLKLPVAEIHQVSELSVIRGGEIETHCQYCDEITYAISGSAKFFENNNCSVVNAGQIHFIKKGNTHKIEVLSNENFRYICIGFTPTHSSEIIKSFYDDIKDLQSFTVKDNGTVKHLSEYLVREFYNFDKYSRDMINEYLSQILVTIIRSRNNQILDFHKNESSRSSNYAMYKLLRYLDREYLQIDNVKAVAENLSYSEYYLSHLFKEKMGITIKEYLTKKKISYATELIRTSELTVEQIATILGFSCAYSFRRSFKECTGLTPSEYKKSVL